MRRKGVKMMRATTLGRRRRHCVDDDKFPSAAVDVIGVVMCPLPCTKSWSRASSSSHQEEDFRGRQQQQKTAGRALLLLLSHKRRPREKAVAAVM